MVVPSSLAKILFGGDFPVCEGKERLMPNRSDRRRANPVSVLALEAAIVLGFRRAYCIRARAKTAQQKGRIDTCKLTLKADIDFYLQNGWSP